MVLVFNALNSNSSCALAQLQSQYIRNTRKRKLAQRKGSIMVYKM